MNRRFYIWLTLSLLWMAVIWQFSATPGEEQDLHPWLSRWITLTEDSLPKLSFYYGNYFVTSERPYEFVIFLIRKMAHVTEYAILAILSVGTLHQLRLTAASRYGLAWLATVGYAGIDEWHQTFVPGRSGMALDVFGPDLLGALVGLGLFALWRKLRIKRN